MTGAITFGSKGNYEKAVRVLRAFAHPLRIKLINCIHTPGKINVNKIYKSLNLEQSVTSQHLRILRDAGLVLTHREGKFIFYSLNYPKISQIGQCVKRFTSTM